MNPIINTLTTLDACDESIKWVQRQETKDPQILWNSCPRADWLLWLIAKTTKSEPYSEGRKPLVRCLVELVKLIPDMPEVGLDCIKTTEKWLDGKATNEELRQATTSAYAAACDDAVAVVYTAYTAYAAYIAKIAYNLIYSINHIAYYATAYIASFATHKQCLKIIYKHFPNPPKIEGLQ